MWEHSRWLSGDKTDRNISISLFSWQHQFWFGFLLLIHIWYSSLTCFYMKRNVAGFTEGGAFLDHTACASSLLLGSLTELCQTESCSSSEGDTPVIHMPALPGTLPVQTGPLVTVAVFMHLWRTRNSFSRRLWTIWIYIQLKMSCNYVKIVIFFLSPEKNKLEEGMLLGEPSQALERDLN